MRRREFIAILGAGAAVTWSRAHAQKTRPMIGFLNATSANEFTHVVDAFRRGLNETGYVEGGNVAIEYRWVDDQYDRLPALAADLVRRQVSVIATGSSTSAALAAKNATTNIPIVFLTGADPIQLRLVASLNRPGGNLTGITTLNVEIAPKRLEVLRELLPTAVALAMLVNPINNRVMVETDLRQAQTAARSLGLQTIEVLQASSDSDLEQAFSTLAEQRAGGLVISPDTFFSSKSIQLAGLALRYAMPAVSPYREFVMAGGLMSYGASVTELYRLVGVYVGRVLNGEKPAELPVQQAEKVELIVNLKTAKALGVVVPASLLARADEVIE
jgi:ABC-type uncharacterized transport system substrate-binding protein